MKLTFLGTGTSFGVPQIGCDCAVCTSPDPRDRRSRVSVVVEGRETTILIDTPPELRLQLIAARVKSVDAVLYTHDHADHTHGIDDIRAFTARRGRALPVYASHDVLERLSQRFPYIFDPSVVALPGTWKPQVIPTEVAPLQSFTAGALNITPLPVPHGDMEVFGYRIGPVAYITDAKSIPDAVVSALAGVKVLVLNALLKKPHPSHLSIAEGVAAAARVGAERTFFTHLTHQFTHASLLSELPPGVEPAYDGLEVEVPEG